MPDDGGSGLGAAAPRCSFLEEWGMGSLYELKPAPFKSPPEQSQDGYPIDPGPAAKVGRDGQRAGAGTTLISHPKRKGRV